MAASATFALKVAVWFRRGRLFMVSPDSLGTACPLSGRNSTYRSVQISETSSGRRKVAKKIAKNKRCYANTLRPRSRMLLKVMTGGVRGSLPPLGHLRRGGGGALSPGAILPLRGTGEAAIVSLAEKRHPPRCREPGNFAARVLVGRRPGSCGAPP